ncbi:hypothetical protein ABW19_dt0208110 [Dactylella cylindrospora]|nr:hypothetical protein ABW19_dt0208110 [Dactylella cylindrospora]
MLEYLSYRKFKKHKEAKEAGAKEVLDSKDEKYFEGLVDDPQAQEVPLQASSGDTITPSSSSPAGGATPAETTPSTSEANATPKKHTWRDTVSEYATDTYEKAKQVKIREQLPAFLQKKEKDPAQEGESPKKEKKDKKGKGKSKEEEEYYAELTAEEKELHDALDALSIAAQDGKAFSLSADTRALLQRFTQILKDMVNGVPTAYDDLISLFETKSKQIEELFESTPGFVKSLAKKLPSALGLTEKALEAEEGAGSAAGLAAQAATLSIPTLKQLVTKPSAVTNALKTVVNAIKLRFPGIALGTNVIISMALFVLLFVFWYCYKRGKEVRLEKERLEREAEEAQLAESLTQAVLDEAPAVPTTDPSTSVATTTNTAINEAMESPQTPPIVVPAESSPQPSSSTALAAPVSPEPEAKPEKQIKDLF